jgi:demethylmenaquinone methyltransferase/2-methoxy-6-polyprenyl-1,4-benzoquinol methylase
MFARIARRYDLMNRLMTFGQDRRWRRFVVEQTALPEGGRLLDIATGTGEIAFEAIRRDRRVQVVGADFTLGMMRVGQARALGRHVAWLGADTFRLPFPDGTFDAATSGYLMRNVTDAAGAFREQARVVKPGGRVVCLDTSPPPRNLLRPLIVLHLRVVIPFLGRIITGQADAYRYLPDSTQAFKTPDELAAIMREAGLADVHYRRFTLGTMAVHVGVKP